MVGAIDLNRPAVQVNRLVTTRLCHVTSLLAAATRGSQRARARQRTPSPSQSAAFELNCKVPKNPNIITVFLRGKMSLWSRAEGYRQDVFAANGKDIKPRVTPTTF
jgi:hypothetical protein